MTTAIATVDDVIARIRDLAAASPDCVYKAPGSISCYYSRGECSNGSVGCVVGQALASFGFDTVGIDDSTLGIASDVCSDLGLDTLSRQGEWLDAVQSEQDNGRTWAEAIERADELFPLR